MRTAPTIKHSERFYDCTFLACGFDTVEESASVYVLGDVWERLEEAKEYAADKNTGSNQAYTTFLGGMEFQIKPHGGAGVSFILSNNLYTVAIRPAKTAYNLSVKFSSWALWHYGAQGARERFWGAILTELKPRPVEDADGNASLDDWRRLSRADFAFDFHAPDFTLEFSPDMASQIVCHSSVKVRHDFKARDEAGKEIECYMVGTSTRQQTLTIGTKKSLQVQVYNKSDEITEKSGKTWMQELWARTGFRPESDVWRIEARFSREYLASRNIDTFEDFEDNKEKLLTEALKTRRLTDKTGDSNRRRWPVHPMWSQAITYAGDTPDMMPVGRHEERAAQVLIDKLKQDIKAALRRHHSLKVGGMNYSDSVASNLLMEVLTEIAEDENHEAKMEEYAERYKYIHEPV